MKMQLLGFYPSFRNQRMFFRQEEGRRTYFLPAEKEKRQINEQMTETMDSSPETIELVDTQAH